MRFETSLFVRSAETDFTGIVHHASYLTYFEQARNDAMREIGLTYDELDKIGCMIAITSARQKYKSPAYYDDLLTISTWITKFNSFVAAFEYIVTRGSEEIAIGETELIFLDKVSVPGKSPSPFRIPRPIVERVKKYIKD
jgi:acyl-CoA thioester hydrolase